MRASWIVAGCAVFLSGCEHRVFRDRPATLHFDPITKPGEPAPPVDPEQSAVDNFYSKAAKDRGELTPRDYRNKVAWQQIRRDEDSFNRFADEVRSDQALMNLTADGGVTMLSALGALTGTAGEKAALAVLSGTLLSAKGSINQQMFNLQTMTALLTRMEAARREAFVPIKRGLSLSAEAYTIDEALFDLRRYVRAGSLSSTLRTLSTDAGKTEAKADEEVETIVQGTVYRDTLATREELMDRADALKGQQYVALAFALEPYRGARDAALIEDLRAKDPDDSRFHDPVRARSFLLHWLVRDAGTPAEMDEWSRAISTAEKGKP
jgi:hypothetical protein